MVTVIKQELILSEDELVRLNIIDFGRNNGGVFGGPHKAIRVISNHVVRSMVCTITEDTEEYPERDDFPGWSHVGNHVAVGKKYWNKLRKIYSSKNTWLYSK